MEVKFLLIVMDILMVVKSQMNIVMD